MLQVKLLGQFDVRRDGTPIAIPSRAAQLLLAYLLLTAGTTHRREELAGLLWPDTTDENARKNLRHELWRLRKALESAALQKSQAPYLLVDEISIGFNAQSDYWLDVATVQKQMPKGASADDLVEMLSVYQGALLPGLYDDWALRERDRVRAVLDNKMTRLLDLLIEEKRWEQALEWGERWIALGQTPEPAFRALMVAQRAVGNVSQVAAAYKRYAQAMRSDLGVEPSDEMSALFERLSRPVAPALETPTPGQVPPEPLSSFVLRRPVFPVPLTSFIGRERDLERIKRSLLNTRLLTLVGPGGIGKTRLAIKAATEVLRLFPDGAWWCDLTALEDPEHVPQAVANVLGVPEVPRVPLIETLARVLGSRQVMLVLDNCEHLVEACAEFAAHLLTACPSMKILATSREVLGIAGETTCQVPSLSLPERDLPFKAHDLERYESIRLFVERARAVDSDFDVTEENASALVQVCQRLDGIPLAIELAAVRVRTLSITQIAGRLDDRFNLLTRGNRSAMPRHQTLRATMDWSHELLSEMERVLFRRLSVFAGGWTLDAAEAICTGDRLEPVQVLDLLTRLVDKSLVVVSQQNQAARYRMLESVREYALEKMEEADEKKLLQLRHCEWFAALAVQAEAALRGANQLRWLDRLEAEHDNLREAWHCAIESDVRLAVKLASGMLNFWLMRGNVSEGHSWSATLLARTRDWEHTTERAHVLAIAALGNYLRDEVAPARLRLEDALGIARVAGDKAETAFVLLWIGRVAFLQKDISAARACTEEGLAIYQELNDPWGIARGTYLLANILAVEGKDAEAEEALRSSWAKFQALGDKFSLGFVSNALGELARQREDYESAGRFYEQSIEIFSALRSRAALESPAGNLALVQLHRGDYRGAQALFEQVLNVFMEQGDRNSAMYTLAGFVGILAKTSRPEQAARLLGTVEAWFQEIGNGRALEPQDQKELDRYTAVIRGQLDQAVFEKACLEGRTMTLEQAVALATERLSDTVH